MLANTISNLAMAQAQERDQQSRFAQQTAANNYGVDHLGNPVNRDQRQSWNDRLSKFRQAGGPVNSQQMYRRLQAGQDQFGGNEQRGSGLGGYGARGVEAFGQLRDNMRDRFGGMFGGRQQQGGYNLPARGDSPYGIGYDTSDGWAARNDGRANPGATGLDGPGGGGWGMADDHGNDTGSRGFY